MKEGKGPVIEASPHEMPKRQVDFRPVSMNPNGLTIAIATTFSVNCQREREREILAASSSKQEARGIQHEYSERWTHGEEEGRLIHGPHTHIHT